MQQNMLVDRKVNVETKNVMTKQKNNKKKRNKEKQKKKLLKKCHGSLETETKRIKMMHRNALIRTDRTTKKRKKEKT